VVFYANDKVDLSQSDPIEEPDEHNFRHEGELTITLSDDDTTYLSLLLSLSEESQRRILATIRYGNYSVPTQRYSSGLFSNW